MGILDFLAYISLNLLYKLQWSDSLLLLLLSGQIQQTTFFFSDDWLWHFYSHEMSKPIFWKQNKKEMFQNAINWSVSLLTFTPSSPDDKIEEILLFQENRLSPSIKIVSIFCSLFLDLVSKCELSLVFSSISFSYKPSLTYSPFKDTYLVWYFFYILYSSTLLITKTCIFKYIEKFNSKNWTFSDKKLIFLYFISKHWFAYALEPPRWGGPNEYPQSMFLK